MGAGVKIGRFWLDVSLCRRLRWWDVYRNGRTVVCDVGPLALMAGVEDRP